MSVSSVNSSEIIEYLETGNKNGSQALIFSDTNDFDTLDIKLDRFDGMVNKLEINNFIFNYISNEGMEQVGEIEFNNIIDSKMREGLLLTDFSGRAYHIETKSKKLYCTIDVSGIDISASFADYLNLDLKNFIDVCEDHSLGKAILLFLLHLGNEFYATILEEYKKSNPAAFEALNERHPKQPNRLTDDQKKLLTNSNFCLLLKLYCLNILRYAFDKNSYKKAFEDLDELKLKPEFFTDNYKFSYYHCLCIDLALFLINKNRKITQNNRGSAANMDICNNDIDKQILQDISDSNLLLGQTATTIFTSSPGNNNFNEDGQEYKFDDSILKLGKVENFSGTSSIGASSSFTSEFSEFPKSFTKKMHEHLLNRIVYMDHNLLSGQPAKRGAVDFSKNPVINVMSKDQIRQSMRLLLELLNFPSINV